jgi:hypothetical protein
MALLADDATDRAEQVLSLTYRLTELLALEHEALAAGNPLTPPAQSEEFQRLANAYRAEMRRIRDDPSLLAPAPLGLRQSLQTATAALQALLDDHVRALTAARSLTEGLLSAIADEVKRTAASGSTYGAQGGYARHDPTSLALDKRA